jgi:prophage regulatory protein
MSRTERVHQAETNDAAPDKPVLRRMMTEAEVLAAVPFSRTTLWRREKEGTFPRSTYYSANRRAWFEDEVIAWQASLISGGRRRGRSKR